MKLSDDDRMEVSRKTDSAAFSDSRKWPRSAAVSRDRLRRIPYSLPPVFRAVYVRGCGRNWLEPIALL
jgi:hypothetical protein